MKTAVALLRVSTPDQQLGLQAQRADIERFAAREGIEVVAWQTEIVSGGAELEKRHGLQAALAFVAQHKAACLLVSKRDRLCRDPLVALLTERALAKVNATVLAADGNNDNDPFAEAMRGMLDVFARLERRMIGIRTKAALAALRAGGKVLGRPVGVIETKPRKPRSDKGKRRLHPQYAAGQGE